MKQAAVVQQPVARPRVCFVCVRYGEPEKIYLQRQYAAFTRVEPALLAWADHRAGGAEALALVGVDWDPSGSRRFARSLRRRLGLESFGPSRTERRLLARHLEATAPDVVYAHVGFVGMRLLPVTRDVGIPLVLHLHGIELHRAWRDRRLAGQLLRAIESSERVVVVARYMERWIAQQGVATDHVRVIPMGAPTTDQEPAAPSGSDGPRVLAIGRLVPYKGFDRAIDAFAEVCAGFPGARLRIVGDGPERERLERRVDDLRVGPQVELLGALAPAQTDEQLEWCDLLVHPASDEPDGPEAAGVVISEAAARARPVLATRCGGIPDQVISGRTGILVPQNDHAALVAALREQLVDEAGRRRMGREAWKHAVSRFDASRMAERVEGVLFEVCAANSPRPALARAVRAVG